MPIRQNTTSLEEILAKVNALPETDENAITPTGTIEITENGTHDVTSYASANVNVEQGVFLPELTNPATADDVLQGKETIDGDGNKITGTIETKDSGDVIVLDGNVTVPKGYYSSNVEFQVPNEPVINSLEITENGTYTAPDNVDGYSPITVNVQPELQEKTITPTTDSQEVVADDNYDALSKVTINAIPDEYVIPTGNKTITENGEHSVSGYASATVNVEPELEELTVTENGEYTPTVDGFSKVTVNVETESGIVPSGTLDITTNGTHDVTNYASANVNVPSNGIDTSDATATASDIAKDATAYVNGEKITGTLPSVASGGMVQGGNVSVTKNVETIQLTITNSADRILRSGAKIYGITAPSTFGDATASDVAAGKTFTSSAGLKVTGTAEGATPSLQEKTVTPQTYRFAVNPDTGYDGLSKVTINAIPSDYVIPTGSVEITENGSHDVSGYASATVNVEPELEEITITENGEYTPTVDGFSKVTVNVPSSGGESGGGGLPDTIVAGDTPILGSWTGKQVTSTTVTATGLSVTIPQDGTYRFKIPCYAGSSYMGGSGKPTVHIYKNGVEATSLNVTSNLTAPLSADLECSAKDVISIYATAYKQSYTTINVTVLALIACIDA